MAKGGEKEVLLCICIHWGMHSPCVVWCALEAVVRVSEGCVLCTGICVSLCEHRGRCTEGARGQVH